MPARSGRSGGSSRSSSSRPSFSRSSRTSSSGSGGSRGFHVNFGNRAPRASTSLSDNETSDPNRIHRRPYYGNSGFSWTTILMIIGVILLGICACAAVVFVLNSMGYFS